MYLFAKLAREAEEAKRQRYPAVAVPVNDAVQMVKQFELVLKELHTVSNTMRRLRLRNHEQNHLLTTIEKSAALILSAANDIEQKQEQDEEDAA